MKITVNLIYQIWKNERKGKIKWNTGNEIKVMYNTGLRMLWKGKIWVVKTKLQIVNDWIWVVKMCQKLNGDESEPAHPKK